MFETKSSYCRVARQGLLCYKAVARLSFKRHATALLKSNLIRSIEFGTAVARRLKQALYFECAHRRGGDSIFSGKSALKCV